MSYISHCNSGINRSSIGNCVSNFITLLLVGLWGPLSRIVYSEAWESSCFPVTFNDPRIYNQDF